MNWSEICLAIIGGFFAGCINTLSGNGSIITLGFMTEILGMSPQIANGTNRIGLLTQGLASLEAFRHHGRLSTYQSKPYIITGIVGAVAGSICSIFIEASLFKEVYKMLMLSMFVLAILRPERWIRYSKDAEILPKIVYIPLFLILGFYGGFIQMGMGIFFLFLMVNILQKPIIEANVVKLIMVTTYTFLVIFIFHRYHMVDWHIGIVIAVGQGIGGWMMAQWASRIPNVEIWGYYLFLSAIAMTILKVFHPWTYF